MALLKLTRDNFETEVLNSTLPVLIDFYADWCGPCRMLGPVIDEIAEEATDFKVGKVNIDEQPELATKYQVMSVPCLVMDEETVSFGRKTLPELLTLLGV